MWGTKSYTRANIRLALTAVNMALNERGVDVYLRIAKASVAHQLLAKISPYDGVELGYDPQTGGRAVA
jgi:hypothetical protein